MLKIGLTGGICSGKSTACHFFNEAQITVVDADQIARELVAPGQPCYQKMITFFGEDILLPEKRQLNRRKLRERIFKNPTEKAWLESLLHPLILKEMKKRAVNARSPYCILDIPLLTEATVQNFVDRVLLIHCEQATQLQRLMQRDQLSLLEAKNILEQQATPQQRLNFADDVIYNDADLANFQAALTAQHLKYLSTLS